MVLLHDQLFALESRLGPVTGCISLAASAGALVNGVQMPASGFVMEKGGKPY